MKNLVKTGTKDGVSVLWSKLWLLLGITSQPTNHVPNMAAAEKQGGTIPRYLRGSRGYKLYELALSLAQQK